MSLVLSQENQEEIDVRSPQFKVENREGGRILIPVQFDWQPGSDGQSLKKNDVK